MLLWFRWITSVICVQKLHTIGSTCLIWNICVCPYLTIRREWNMNYKCIQNDESSWVHWLISFSFSRFCFLFFLSSYFVYYVILEELSQKKIKVKVYKNFYTHKLFNELRGWFMSSFAIYNRWVRVKCKQPKEIYIYIYIVIIKVNKIV